MIVFDASALIALLDEDDFYHANAVQLFAEHEDDDYAASVVTLGEVLVGPVRRGRVDEARSVLDDLAIEPIGLDRSAPESLANVQGRSRLRMPDCCVLFAATKMRAMIASFDDQLNAAARAAGLQVVVGSPGD